MKNIIVLLFSIALVLGCITSNTNTTTTLKATTTTVATTTTIAITTTTPTVITTQATTTLATATCSDGIKNQGEDDVDCGGPCSYCAILLDKPPEYKTTDYWQYLAYEVSDKDSAWAVVRSYNGKTKISGKDYDEFKIAPAIITETQEVQLVGTADLSHMYSESNSIYLDREVFTSGFGSSTIFRYIPGVLELKFPLKAGDKWYGESDMTWVYTSKSLMTLPVNYSTGVLSEEKVTVMAGTFNTLKIVETLDFMRHGELGVRRITTMWYSPKVRNYVKINRAQEIPGPTDSYRAQQGNVILTFYEYNVTNELMLYSAD